MNKYISLLLLLFIIIISGCSTQNNLDKSQSNLKSSDILLTGGDEIKKFTSDYELKKFLKNNKIENENSYQIRDTNIKTLSVESLSSNVKSSDTSQVYSNTNNQINEVDEGDIVKNDNKYIYLIQQNKLLIIDAYPAKNSKILFEKNISASPKELFVKNNRLILFINDYEEGYKIAEFDFAPSKVKNSITRVLVFNIENKNNPILLKNYTINGNYFQSRMIDNQIYFISKMPIYYSDDIVIPEIKESNFRIATPPVYYFDNPEQSYTFYTIGSLNILEDQSTILAKTFMLGNSNNLYFSKNNIYISYQKNFPYSYYEYLKVDRFFKIIVPLLPKNIQNEIAKVEGNLQLSSKESYIEAWDKISIILENMYNYMEDLEKKELISKIQKSVNEYETRIEEERGQTIIHKIAISNGEIEYKTRGQIKGSLLNQFSMDEKDGMLRVATTTQFYSREKGFITNNNVYILDFELEKIGQIEKIAPNEKIYSTRFIDDRLYMVTFKRTDPLFTIDLSNPSKPKILGQLKVPGFSNYLHPYDENFLIGIGKETNENKRGQIITKGVKLSLFDVSNINEPKEIDTVIIGNSGSNTNVLNDHKAFLFDRDKNLLALPIRKVTENLKENKKDYYSNKIWNGAYVFTITKNGFKERGKISHNDNEDEKYFWNSPFKVKRLLFMDDNLYTISNKFIKINDLGTIDEIGEIKLPYKENNYYNDGPILLESK